MAKIDNLITKYNYVTLVFANVAWFGNKEMELRINTLYIEMLKMVLECLKSIQSMAIQLS
jgi:hypothetical protein